MFNPNQFPVKPQDSGPNPFESCSQDLGKALSQAKESLIIVRENPKVDHLASALALYLSLKKASKSVSIACPTAMRVEFNRLIGIDKISSKIGNRNLVISFPYVKDSIEKVSYNVDDQNFNLVIQPKPGFPSLDSDQVKYSYSGAEADLVFVIGAQKLEDLSLFYQAEKKLFDTATVINIDSNPTNTKYASINLVWAEFSSCAEVVFEFIERLGGELDQDIATNLLTALNDATQNFQRFNLKPKAFEVAAKLMQSGAKRPLTTPTTPPNPFAGLNSTPLPSLKPQTLEPSLTSSNLPTPQSDWLKPKIFTGSSPAK